MTAEAPGTPIIAPPSPPSELSRWRSYKRPTLVAECLVVILNVFVRTGWHLHLSLDRRSGSGSW